ncbi:MAG: hypothetical protein KME20_15810 [Kaiparowitsia implicata GSE-PSE-MK54-09C]|nr:hypothetical protein [Kaiparowitsia implicata GSE-PSE-MK54-09C]
MPYANRVRSVARSRSAQRKLANRRRTTLAASAALGVFSFCLAYTLLNRPQTRLERVGDRSTSSENPAVLTPNDLNTRNVDIDSLPFLGALDNVDFDYDELDVPSSAAGRTPTPAAGSEVDRNASLGGVEGPQNPFSPTQSPTVDYFGRGAFPSSGRSLFTGANAARGGQSSAFPTTGSNGASQSGSTSRSAPVQSAVQPGSSAPAPSTNLDNRSITVPSSAPPSSAVVPSVTSGSGALPASGSSQPGSGSAPLSPAPATPIPSTYTPGDGSTAPSSAPQRQSTGASLEAPVGTAPGQSDTTPSIP